MACQIFNVGCDCQTIVVSLKNDALLYHSYLQGIYQRAGKVNARTSWNSSRNYTDVMAIWYNPSDWMIGPVDYLGTDVAGISTRGPGTPGTSSCPYYVPNDAWKYVIDGSWINTDANDVSIECLTGNDN